MNTYAYEYFLSVEKLCPLGYSPVCFTHVHAVPFLSRNHAPEGGRGDDEATENSLFDFFGVTGEIAVCNHAFGT